MDPRTARIYEEQAESWIARRRPRALEDGSLERFAARIPPGGRVADLGCGPGWYAAAFRERGFRTVALDVSTAMLREARARDAEVACVRGDLFALPFVRGSLDAAWASACYQHLPLAELPVALARLHSGLRTGAPLRLVLANLSRHPRPEEHRRGETETCFDDDEFGGRLFSLVTAERARTLLEGAGFDSIKVAPLGRGFWLTCDARAGRTLPDWIAPDLRILVCGLNPSLFAADRGLPFGRPGNRFWPAAVRAGWVAQERSLPAALRAGIGFTDCAKRATRRADELAPEEYRAGLERVEALIAHYRPRVVCFVGLEGYRTARERRTRAGWLPQGFGSRPAYLMPSTSGKNAHASLADLVAHMERAARGP